MNKNLVTFRCKHRHSALTHPRCFLRHLTEIEKKNNNLPKVLVFDIETSPLQAYVWQHNVWNTSIPETNVISEWFMLTWSAKWLYDETIMSDKLTGKEALKEDDGRIVKGLWKLLDDADIVISHNGDRFDVPNMNTRFIVNDLPPTSPYQSIDTVRIARRQFGFTHNNLNALARVFGFPAKLETNFELWKRCVAGEDDALQEMEIYNQGDVELLEKVYIKLRPWIKSHPNIALYTLSDGTVCPNCGSNKIKWLPDKYYYTTTNRYPIFTCECGAYGRSRFGETDKEFRKTLAVSVAR